MKNLFLIDASGFIWSAYYVLQMQHLKNPDGIPISAVYGYCNSIIDLYQKFKPEQIIAVFDTKAKTFRSDIYKDYKANRDEPPEDLIPQFPIVREATDALGIPRIEIDGYEADDIIATYAKEAEKKGVTVTIVSSDKDLMQLVNKNTKMYNPWFKDKETKQRGKYFGIKEVKEKFGVSPSKMIDLQALAGDSVDNIPGVSGIGPKIGAELINEFGTLENLLTNLDKIKQEKRRQKLIDDKEKALISKKLVTLKDDLKLKSKYNSKLFKGINQKTALEFFKKQGFNSLIKRFEKKSDNNSIDKSITKNKIKYSVIQSLDDLKSLEKRIQKKKIISVDTETNSINANFATLVGISLSLNENEAFYLPFKHNINDKDKFKNLELSKCLPVLKKILEEKSITKVGHNIKYDKIILSNVGINLNSIEDTMLLSYVLDTGKLRHNLNDLSKIYLNNENIKYKDVVGVGKKEKTFDNININDAYNYACEDADMTLRLYNILKKRIVSEKLLSVYEYIEKPLIMVLVKMEQEGIKIDIDQIKSLSKFFKKKLSKIEKEIFNLSDLEFNIASPKQLGEILFEKMGLEGGKKGKSGAYSTSVDVLENLSYQGHKIATYLLEWRQISKLINTYTDSLINEVNKKTSRIHTSYSMASTSTGRLSSTDPNLQNIPIRTEEGKKIRNTFISKNGFKLVSLDYSQIELRLLAHIGKVESLKNAFEQNIDIHKKTASQIFNVKLEDVTKELRRKAKTINYGIIYGIGSFGLAKQLNIKKSEAELILDEYFKNYKGILDYTKNITEFCKKNGFVKTLFGRKCYIEGINNTNPRFRNFAIRAAVNAPIQGSAADIIKKAMINIDKFLEEKKVKSKMILQVHDELLFEMCETEINYLSIDIKKIMENAALPEINLDIPLIVDYGKGSTWAEAH